MQKQALFQVDHLQNHLSSSGCLSGDFGDIEGLRCKLFLQTRRTRSAIVGEFWRREGKKGRGGRRKERRAVGGQARWAGDALPHYQDEEITPGKRKPLIVRRIMGCQVFRTLFF